MLVLNPPVCGGREVSIWPRARALACSLRWWSKDQSGWIITLITSLIHSPHYRVHRLAISLDHCQPAGVCGSSASHSSPWGEMPFKENRRAHCLEEGWMLSGTPASFVCCLSSASSCTQMVHFAEAGGRFLPYMFIGFFILPCRHPSLILSFFCLHLSRSLLQSTEWHLKTSYTISTSAFQRQNAL